MAQPLLSGEVEYVDSEPVTDLRLDEHGRRITELEDRIQALEQKIATAKRDAVVALLQMFADSIRQIASGKMDIPEFPATAPVSDNRMAPAWQKWIDKFGAGSSKGKFIKALLEHSSLNARQLLVHIGTSRLQTVYNTAFELTKIRLIQKNGEMYTLVG